MNEKQDVIAKENEQADAPRDNDLRERNESSIGAGKKTGLYGCGFLILAVVIVFIVLVLTGIYNPFQGTEGVGP
ncbi:MAG: hypothetical protein M3367_19525 [Acidobacteriota bacterium]|nr:hypothetical protein [Acidobacteriota bacterium]